MSPFHPRFVLTSQAGGKNKASSGVKAAMALSGSTLPQISTTNASISGIFHIITSDGAGPLSAIIDPTGKGDFTNGIKAKVTLQIPGKNGNIKKTPTQKRWEPLEERGDIEKRASNINEDYVSEEFLCRDKANSAAIRGCYSCWDSL